MKRNLKKNVIATIEAQVFMTRTCFKNLCVIRQSNSICYEQGKGRELSALKNTSARMCYHL